MPKPVKKKVIKEGVNSNVESLGAALSKGDKAPDFSLPDQNGKVHKLSSYRGKYVVLYFYPKDMTSGCTLEAQGFRDLYPDFKKDGIVLLGISVDDQKSHKEFCDKEALTFPLLSDVDKKVVQEYGVWVKKSMYGRSYMGIQRDTFIIAPDGSIENHFAKVDPTEHPGEVLAYFAFLL
jgi:peroxiredoxin Q/BCP